MQPLENAEELRPVARVEAGAVVAHEEGVLVRVRDALTSITGFSSSTENLIAFETRFTQTCASRLRSPTAAGRYPRRSSGWGP